VIADTPAADQSLPRPERPVARYGAPPRPRRRRVVVVAVCCAVLAAVGLGWVVVGMLQPRAEGEVGVFDVIDSAHADFVLEVTRPPDRTAVCTVEALGEGFGQVGLIDVTVEPSDAQVVRVGSTIATSTTASVVTVTSCRLL
jgi:hypothetical protein